MLTDQRALRHLLEQREIQPEYQKWLTKLLGYDFEIKYHPGLLNKAIDALSRVTPTGEMMPLTLPSLIDIGTTKSEVEQDVELQKIRQELQEDPLKHPIYSLKHGMLHYKGWLVLSSKSSLIPTLLQIFLDSDKGGHSGFLRTYKRLTEELFWKGMKNEVKKYVEQCKVCQTNKIESVAPTGLLQPLPRLDKIWEDLSMDFIEGLPTSQGVDTIMVVVDRPSKYAHFVTLKHPFSAKIVVVAFVKQIVRLHGFPRSIVSD